MQISCVMYKCGVIGAKPASIACFVSACAYSMCLSSSAPSFALYGLHMYTVLIPARLSQIVL